MSRLFQKATKFKVSRSVVAFGFLFQIVSAGKKERGFILARFTRSNMTYNAYKKAAIRYFLKGYRHIKIGTNGTVG
jgi:hypothetical protein